MDYGESDDISFPSNLPESSRLPAIVYIFGMPAVVGAVVRLALLTVRDAPFAPTVVAMELKGMLAEAINDQITLEIQASVVYRQLSIEMAVRDLPGISGWFLAQSAEELEHAQKFTDHMTDRNATPRIGMITAPNVVVNTVLEAFEASLAHEQKVSESIRNLYRLAQQEGDIDSIPLLNWFIEEQLEEEATVGEIIGRVRLIGNDGNGLLRLDAELAARQDAGK